MNVGAKTSDCNTPQPCDKVSKVVAWFRGEDRGPKERLFRNIAAIVAAVLLTLTIVGIYFVVKGGVEWIKQESLSKKKLLPSEKAASIKKTLIETKPPEELQIKNPKDKPAKIELQKQGVLKAGFAVQQLSPKKTEGGTKVLAMVNKMDEEAKRQATLKKAEEEEKLKAASKKEEDARLEAAAKKAQEEAKSKVAAEEAARKAIAEEKAKLQTVSKKAEIVVNPAVLSQPTPAIAQKTQHSIEKISEKTEPVSSKGANDFPAPYETIRRMKQYNQQDLPAIRSKMSTALKTAKGERVPSEYPKLEKLIGSSAQLEKLYDEAQIIAHYVTCADLADFYDPKVDVREYEREYKISGYANLDKLVSYLCKHKEFPKNPFGLS